MPSRYVTDPPVDPRERFSLRRLCQCTTCGGAGKGLEFFTKPPVRCPDCRGEGRTLQEVATCATPEAVGVALYTLALEGEWDECPIGILDRIPTDPDHPKWLVKPWLPSARNLSDAGRQLQTARKGKT